MSSAKALDGLAPRESAGIAPRNLQGRKARTTLQFISDTTFFLKLLAFAAAVPYLLRLKLSRVADLLEWRGNLSVTLAQEHCVEKIANSVELAIRYGRPIVRPGCLTRGLTRYYFLRRAGMDVTLCFGMGRVNNGFMGHCWLVRDEEPFLEAEDPRPRYVEVYRVSHAGGRASIPGAGGGLRRFRGS
jgi:hypothetical protein